MILQTQLYSEVLPKKYLKEIQEIIKGNKFSWCFYEEATVVVGSHPKIKHKDMGTTPGMAHVFMKEVDNQINTSNHWPLIWPMKFFMSEKTGLSFDYILRCKVNLLFQSHKKQKESFNTPHIDHDDAWDYYNVLFFPFDSDGDFFIFKEHHKDGIPNTVNIEEVITPKENSMVVFDGWKYHASSNPIEDQTRMTINWTIKGK